MWDCMLLFLLMNFSLIFFLNYLFICLFVFIFLLHYWIHKCSVFPHCGMCLNFVLLTCHRAILMKANCFLLYSVVGQIFCSWLVPSATKCGQRLFSPICKWTGYPYYTSWSGVCVCLRYHSCSSGLITCRLATSDQGHKWSKCALCGTVSRWGRVLQGSTIYSAGLYSCWFTSASQSDHYIRYVCVSVCPEHNSVDFDPILMKLGYVFDINV